MYRVTAIPVVLIYQYTVYYLASTCDESTFWFDVSCIRSHLTCNFTFSCG